MIGHLNLPLKDFRQLDCDRATLLAQQADFYKKVIKDHDVKDISFLMESDVFAKITFVVPALDVVPVERKQKGKKKDKQKSEKEKQRAQS